MEIKHINSGLDEMQASIIQKGIEKGVDVTLYSNSAYSWEHMSDILDVMLKSYDPTPLLNPSLTSEQRYKIALEIELNAEGITLTANDSDELNAMC